MTPHADTELLSAYLDGEVPGSERAGLEQHLASCSECSAKKDALEGVVRSLKGLPEVRPTGAEVRALRQAVLEASGPAKAGGAARRWRRTAGGAPAGTVWKVLGAAAAAAAVLVGIVTFAANKVSGPPATTAAKQAPAAPAPSPPATVLGSDADVRTYARSLTGVSTFLGQTHAAPNVAAAPAPQVAPAPTFSCCALGAGRQDSTTPTTTGGPATSAKSDTQAPSPLSSPVTLPTCTRAIVPSGAAVLGASPVTYQGTPAWLVAYAAPSSNQGVLDQVIVEVRSQAACALLDRSTLAP
ncbi:MAG TPA: zf-HC2 domain-containing protein [Actinomycetota bacterium]|nr:zf-HC2 domain-containing protein [Actinomycetota bacterium]